MAGAFKAARRRAVAAIVAAVLPPLSALLWLVEPFWRLRITPMWASRIGELALTTHTYVARRYLKGPEPRTIRVFLAGETCNRQLLDMWKRVIPVVESRVLAGIYQAAAGRLERSRFLRPLGMQVFSEQHALIDRAGPVLTFTATEEKRGRILLERMGVQPGGWFVCIQARDPSYHTQRVGQDAKSHRNCRIDTFLPAARHLVSLGATVLRVGATAETKLEEESGIIDYTSRFREDFGDIYLLGRCRFFVCGATGTSSVPTLFGTPVIAVNLLPLTPNPWGRASLMAPKRFRDAVSGAMVPYAEVARLGAFSFAPEARRDWDDAAHYARLGLVLVDNEPEDILAICQDMIDQFDGRPADPEAVRLQALYKSRFYADSPDFIAHGCQLGPSFALKYRSLIEG